MYLILLEQTQIPYFSIILYLFEINSFLFRNLSLFSLELCSKFNLTLGTSLSLNVHKIIYDITFKIYTCVGGKNKYL